MSPETHSVYGQRLHLLKMLQAICSSGGDVLNVGFGLGLVDRAIQSNHPASHTIIEAHPDVLHKVHFLVK